MKKLMSIVSRLFESFDAAPRLLRFGIVIFALSAVIDLSYHIVSSFFPVRLDAYLGPDGYYAHLALFFGMLLILIGVMLTKPQPASVVETRSKEETFYRR